MPTKSHYGVQTFVLDRRGRLVNGRVIACDTAEVASALAARIVDLGRAVGAAAFLRRGVGEFDDGEPPVTLVACGRVPEEVRVAVPY